MKISLKDIIYQDILINIPEFLLPRYVSENHLPDIDPEGKEDKDTVHSWPNQYAIDRFHRKHKELFEEELEFFDISILDSEYLFIYLSQSQALSEAEGVEALDFMRFKYLQYYFSIERLVHWASKNIPVNITLYYQETFPNKFSKMLRISNSPLIDYLMKHPKRGELVWKVEIRDHPSNYLYIDYPMSSLVFKEMELYFDNPFAILRGNPREEVPHGYLISSDKDRYDKIVEKSYQNFLKMVESPILMEKIKDHYQRFIVTT